MQKVRIEMRFPVTVSDESPKDSFVEMSRNGCVMLRK